MIQQVFCKEELIMFKDFFKWIDTSSFIQIFNVKESILHALMTNKHERDSLKIYKDFYTSFLFQEVVITSFVVSRASKQ